MRPDIEDEPIEDEHMSRRRAAIMGVLIVVAIGSATWLDGREARARCRAGVDTAASCRGVVR